MAPDIAALSGREFDYLVPPSMAGRIRVGSIVRAPFHGRRVKGWVVGLSRQPSTERRLLALARLSSDGPGPEIVELASWAAWRWAGPANRFLGTASPPRAAFVDDGPRPRPLAAPGAGRSPGDVVVVRVPPAGDPFPLVAEAAAGGDILVLAPSLAEAAIVAARLRNRGHAVAEVPRDWARAAAGGCSVVGARAGAWAPVPRLAAVVVVDEHDEVYQEERAPTWNARDVAVERARRAGVPCVLTSPCPSLDTLARARLEVPGRAEERAGWPVLEVVDRRQEAPGLGLYSERLVALVRGAGPGGRVLCVLNRKGRVVLLACGQCRELARCEACEGPLETAVAGLRCRRCGAGQPALCRWCGAGRLKAVRIGVSRAREELELLAGLDVAEVTADTAEGRLPDAPILVGTEALLHRAAGAAAVAFLDFDQELMAPRYRAAERALALLARAGRVVGGRDGGDNRGRVLVQTRLAGHEALDAALHGDPGRLAVVEAARRAALSLPPETAVVRLSGPGAPELAAALSARLDLEVMGPSHDRWLVRAPDHRTLCDALAATPRPPARTRVEVDPLRA